MKKLQGIDSLKENIDRQVAFNEARNLYSGAAIRSMAFSDETLLQIQRIDDLDQESENMLIDYASNKALQEFCRVNQYYEFNDESKVLLRAIYSELFSSLRSKEYSIEAISQQHYNRLASWLKGTNPFAERLYSSQQENVETVVCSEYSAELQINLLQLDLNRIKEPVLDIGCGINGNLVSFLKKAGIDSYGFDRNAIDNSLISNGNWLDYDYGKEKWGTIISNLGFSNHFRHHHFRNSSNFMEYAKKYVEILASLKIGGSFHYAPDLPFIEQYLSDRRYKLSKRAIENYGVCSVIVTRING
jgi:hypothetical protein